MNNPERKELTMEYCTTIGVDVSDKTSKICVMTKDVI